MSELLRCGACGGAVVWDAAQSGAACLFCGTVSLERASLVEPLPVPDERLPMTITAAVAERRFRAWAGRSWFRAKGLDRVEVGLRPMLLPVWRFHARLETHWAGLRPAKTRSGKAPISGIAHADQAYLVPASAGLSQAELLALQPFDETLAVPWTVASDETEESEQTEAMVWEPPALTRRGARSRAQAGLSDAHRRDIARAQGLSRCRANSVISERDVRLLLVPIYIGVFRHGDRPWRFLINGQTGEVVGRAPIDRAKVLAVTLLVLAILALRIWCDARG